MKTRTIRYGIFSGLLALLLTACVDDLDRQPFYDQTSNTVYADFANYKGVLAKLYGGYAVTGQSAVNAPDISGFDEGKSSYLRAYWMLQEVSTDEAVIGWGSDEVDLHNMTWSPLNPYMRFMYDRIYYQIASLNEFIRETTDEKLNGRGITGAALEGAKLYHAEARFLRALSYWHALDLYGSVPFVTENDGVGTYLPDQISRPDLFAYVESELLAIEPLLKDARMNEYARADKAAVWTLLAKLYLNAPTYTGTPAVPGAGRYTDVITYTQKVIDAGYGMEQDYGHLFLADNHTAQGIIFAIAFDGVKTKSFGGTTFMTAGAIGGDMSAAAFGMKKGGWSGQRTTQQIVDLFPDETATIDERGMFFPTGQSKNVEVMADFRSGYPITKYRNITAAGEEGSDATGEFADIDFPLFRIEDVYLMYAEAVVRNGQGGSMGTAIDYVNRLRERAYNGTTGNVSALTLDFILDERARELNWECYRRTDLIRFGKFTSGNYLWAYKGGIIGGRAVADHREVFPIPASDMAANPKLKQLYPEYN